MCHLLSLAPSHVMACVVDLMKKSFSLSSIFSRSLSSSITGPFRSGGSRTGTWKLEREPAAKFHFEIGAAPADQRLSVGQLLPPQLTINRGLGDSVEILET